MGIRDFARSFKAGNDRELAADIQSQRRAGRSRAATRADRAGQAWEERDRARDRRGRDRQTDWKRDG